MFKTHHTSLKICGITRAEDAYELVACGVEALGVNFWPHSKRYCPPEQAASFLREVAGKIVRVGVFVNAPAELPRQLLKDGLLDIAQFHGDESVEYCQEFAEAGLPFIRAIGVKNADSLENITAYQADAILLDAHAPQVYGGTGDQFDWNLACEFMQTHPNIPVLLAGGITPDNAELATRSVHPVCLDVASGAEFSPGIKDFDKVKALQAAIKAGRELT